MRRFRTRLLLALYPRRFRKRHGEEFIEALLAQRSEPCYATRWGAWRFWRDVGLDVARSATRLRFAGRSRSRATADRRVHRFPSPPSQAEVMWNDLRYALRRLVRRPGFAAAAVLTLGLGIGGASLIFGLVDGLVLRPFHYPDPDRLVAVGVTFPKVSSREAFIEALSPAEYLDIREASTLVDVLGFDLGNRNISGGDVPERVFTALVFGDPFRTLGMKPALGRGFTAEELSPGGPSVAVVSHRIWQSHFGADPSLVGGTIRIGGMPTTVVGVMPAGLLLVGTDLWLPLQANPADWPRGRRQFNVLARLAPGATRQEASAELLTIARRVESDHGARFPEYEGWRLSATPWAAALTRPLRPAATLLAAGVGALLLIVCANIAGLQVARVTGRQRELGIRVALGAGRLRLARELLTEHALLAAAGGLFGIAIAAGGLRAATAALPAQVLALDPDVGFDSGVLMAALAVTSIAALLMGMLPAVIASRLGSGETLRSGVHHQSSGAGTAKVRQALVVVELALALVLLVGAGLMARTLWQLGRIDPGVDTGNVLTMRLTLPWEKYRGPAITHFFDTVLERLEATPGVTASAAASQFPPDVFSDTQILLESRDLPSTTIPSAYLTIATPSYFDVLGIPVIAGRALQALDRAGSQPVAVVNQAFARRYFGERTPVGRRFGVPRGEDDPVWLEIVGVTANTRGLGVAEAPEPEAFVTMDQAAGLWNQLFLLIRTEGDPALLLPPVRRIVAEIDPDQPVYAVRTLEEAFSASVLQQRASAILLSAFAVLALVMAVMGVYAVTAYAVTLRVQEFGIRIALGARARDVTWLVIRQMAGPLALGTILGIAGGLVVGRLAARVLVDTPPHDPVTLGLVVGLLVTVGLLAGYVPARRAARIDPNIALRVE